MRKVNLSWNGNGHFMEQSGLQKRGLGKGQIKMSVLNHRFGEGGR
jgi:hypothetical protein